MCASSRRAWWERSAEAPLFAHHTRGSSSLPRTRLPWRTTRRHAASATAQFLSASRRLAPPRWCGGGVFCCAPCWDYRVGALSLDRCPGPSKYPPCSAGKCPFSLAHAATRSASSASAFENTGCCGKKRTAFAEKSTVFRANSTTFHEDKQRPPKKEVKRNFKFPSAA